MFFFFSFFSFSAGWATPNLVEPWLVDGGGWAVQGLPPQGTSRTDGKIQQGRKEGTASRSLSWLTILKQFIWTAFSHAHFQGKWVNSPNVYQKVEVLETGTSDPKKITKVTQIAFDSPGKQKKK